MLKNCFILFTLLSILFLSACRGVEKWSPVSPVSMDIGSMKRSDYSVLDRVRADSTTTSILFGAVKIIDGDKLEIFWIPFYEEEYAFRRGQEVNNMVINPIKSLYEVSNTEDRAFFKALAAVPDADTIIQQSYSKEKYGIPFCYKSERVTFTGTPIKIKTDNELSSQ